MRWFLSAEQTRIPSSWAGLLHIHGEPLPGPGAGSGIKPHPPHAFVIPWLVSHVTASVPTHLNRPHLPVAMSWQPPPGMSSSVLQPPHALTGAHGTDGLSPYTVTLFAAVARITLPSAMVGGTDLAKSTSLSSSHSSLSVVASNAASRPGTGTHWPSPKGIDVHTMPSFIPLAEIELKPPGIPSVGGLASGPLATRKGASLTCPLERSYLKALRKSFSGIS